jgi:catechol 2,3-dioxygenase-like lactoylglutathione lyase family enzyme
MRIASMALLVRDYDEAIGWFIERLGFELVEDTRIDAVKRWVVVAPRGGAGTTLLLAKASNQNQEHCVGNQAGGRVFLFLHTDDFERDYETMRSRGVEFEEAPRREPYGAVAVFRDLYGNRWDLVERASR